MANEGLPPLDKASEVLKFENGYYTAASVQDFRDLAEAALTRAEKENAELKIRISELEAPYGK